MNVYELSQHQLNQLKQMYVFEKASVNNDSLSWGEIIDAIDIQNEVIFNHFKGINFSENDFNA